MKITMPMFGVSVGAATALGYIPHILFLLIVAISRSSDITAFFLFGTVIARVLGDWIFWAQMFPSRIESADKLEDWRSSIKDTLLSKHNSIRAIFDMIIDVVIDALLIYLAIKASASPVQIFLVLSACQAIGALVHGILIHIFKRRWLRLFSLSISALLTFAALEISGIIPRTSNMDIIGLDTLTKPFAILLIISGKCLLSGTSVIAKTVLAEIIAFEAVKKCTIPVE